MFFQHDAVIIFSSEMLSAYIGAQINIILNGLSLVNPLENRCLHILPLSVNTNHIFAKAIAKVKPLKAIEEIGLIAVRVAKKVREQYVLRLKLPRLHHLSIRRH